jgi:hypothetical protein
MAVNAGSQPAHRRPARSRQFCNTAAREKSNHALVGQAARLGPSALARPENPTIHRRSTLTVRSRTRGLLLAQETTINQQQGGLR